MTQLNRFVHVSSFNRHTYQPTHVRAYRRELSMKNKICNSSLRERVATTMTSCFLLFLISLSSAKRLQRRGAAENPTSTACWRKHRVGLQRSSQEGALRMPGKFKPQVNGTIAWNMINPAVGGGGGGGDAVVDGAFFALCTRRALGANHKPIDRLQVSSKRQMSISVSCLSARHHECLRSCFTSAGATSADCQSAGRRTCQSIITLIAGARRFVMHRVKRRNNAGIARDDGRRNHARTGLSYRPPARRTRAPLAGFGLFAARDVHVVDRLQ
jgi:hypothetical protein